MRRGSNRPAPGLPWLPALRQALAPAAATAVELAHELVRLPTVNPPGGNGEAAALVADRLAALGCRDLEVVEPAPGRCNVLATYGGEGGRSLIWNGHLDVVPVDETRWTRPPFGGEVADGRLWGRGATDMKGSVACAVAALSLLDRAGVELDGCIRLQIVDDEETGGAFGTGHLAEAGRLGRADGAICGEATGLDVCVAAKGLAWLEVRARGRSAHASQPALGANAIEGVAALVAALDELRARLPESELLGKATIVPSIVGGGIKENIVPDECRLVLDRRLLPSEDAAHAREELAELASRVAQAGGVELEVAELSAWEPSEVPREAAIVQTALAVSEAVLGRPGRIVGLSGATDARFLVNRGGTPTIHFGPGSIAQAHTDDEWIEVEQLELATLAFAATFAAFVGAAPP